MSDSRLEKFIYAICSMDVSDLPVPLSRIEKLWNCLITGETPDFEPLSRNEKYLMAMLDRYDISNLPTPMSRGEKLLYKIAVGETDLSDVPGYLSRYEELLKYLIENGGISGGDFEYVLHTLNQSLSTLYLTAEKPVKSAILKGQTLVNLASKNKIGTYKGDNVASFLSIPLTYDFKDDTTYTIFYTLSNTCRGEVSLRGNSNNPIYGVTTKDLEKGVNIAKITTGTLSKTSPTNVTIAIRGGDNEVTISDIIVLEGDYTNQDIPYFEEMQSVRMPVLTTTGKNLFDMSEIVMSDFERNKYQSAYYGKEIQLQPNTTYTIKPYLISEITNTNVWTVFNLIVNGVKTEVVNANYTGSGADKKAWNTQTFETDETGVVGYSIYCNKNNEESWFGNLPIEVQLEEGSTATPYEPFKSNILTVNEEVELRGIGEVQDELNVVTGELTERIGEVVFDGSENWILNGTKTNTNVFRLPYSKLVNVNNRILCDKLPIAAPGDVEKIASSGDAGSSGYQAFYVALLKTKANTLSDFKSYLSENPLTVQYELATPTTKTVDLSIVDQDGNVTTLNTFDDTTHVLLNSEGLIPTAVLTVRTKIPSGSSTSLLMDDISTEQQQLETTVDEQSNNVDATMVATTEIFEETL